MQSIFHKYDIRGIYPEQFNEIIAERIARAFMVFVNEKYKKSNPVIAIGRDGRRGSNTIYDSVINALVDSGAYVMPLGILTTPLTFFVSSINKADFSIMITASHNPKEYNGMKISKGSLPVYENNGLKIIQEYYIKKKKTSGIGDIKYFDAIGFYKNEMLKKFSDLMNYDEKKIVIDASNGLAGYVLDEINKELNIKYIPLNFEIDGNFPNHEPNPLLKESSEQLKKEIIKEKADFGVLFDGDGDRIFLVDENGKQYDADILIAFFSEKLLKESNDEKRIYYDLRCSKIVEEVILKNNGIPVKMPVGNPYYKEKLLKEQGLFGGELSGHLMFREHYGLDDAIFAFFKLLYYIKDEKRKLSEIFDSYQKYFKIPETNFRINKNPDRIIEKIKQRFKNERIEELDGITVYLEDSWFNLRKSNTEPLIRLNLESKNKESVNKLKDEIINLIFNDNE